MSEPATQPAAAPVAAPAAAQAPSTANTAAALPGIPAAPISQDAPAAPAPAAPLAGDEDVIKAAGFETTDDPGLNLAIKFVAARGIKADDPAVQAIRNGDFALLKAKLSSLGDKAAGWQEHVALAEKAFEAAKAKADAAAAETEKAVFSVVGGAEQWAAIAEWAGKTATPEEKASINAALAAGGVQAKAAASYLLSVFQKAGQVIPKAPASAANENAAPATGASNVLTAKQYAEAVQALSAKHGGRDVSGLPEYRALQAARLAGKKRGL